MDYYLHLYQIVSFLGDDEARRWAGEMLDLVGQQGEDEFADVEEVQEAIDEPSLFIEESRSGDDRLYAAFMHFLSLVKKEGLRNPDPVSRRFLLRRQPFVQQLGIFDDGRVGALKLSIEGKARRFRVKSPSDEILERYIISDIDKRTSQVRGYVDVLRDAALDKKLRGDLDDLDRELKDLGSGSWKNGPMSARRRIWEIEWMAGSAVALLHIPDQVFARKAGEIADGLESWFGDVPENRIDKARSLVKDIRACIEGDAVEGRLRDIAVEAHMFLAHLCFSEEHRKRALIEVEPRFEKISEFVFDCIRVGAPETAVVAVSRITGDKALAGAALLDASYRYRLRNSSSSLLKVVAPVLKRARIGISSDEDVSGAEAPVANQLPDELRGLELVQALPVLLGRATPIEMEFGGGWSPHVLEIARERIDRLMVSVDPDPEPIKGNFRTDGNFPDNFIPLLGRAEDVAPFAALAPFARNVVMIAPPSASLNSMVLSALLAVKQGYYVDVYMNAFLDNDLGWVEEAGFDMVDDFLNSGHPDLPSSERLAEYEGVRHIRIKVHDLDTDSIGAPGSRNYKLRGLHGVPPMAGRSGTVSYLRKPVGAAAMLSAGFMMGMGMARIA